MLHSNFQPARQGLTDRNTAKAKALRIMMNGPQVMADDEMRAVCVVFHQRQRLRYSDQGDFTRCYRGGF